MRRNTHLGCVMGKQTMESSLWQRAFDACVWLLREAANLLNPVWPGGMDYVKINVILFCIILPLVLLASLGLNVFLLFVVLHAG